MANLTREDLINKTKLISKSIAIIYSPMELNEYLVEIICNDSDQFIRNGDELYHFKSIDEAMSKAIKLGAEEFFLCADNTYDECSSSSAAQHFDYIPIHSKIKGS